VTLPAASGTLIQSKNSLPLTGAVPGLDLEHSHYERAAQDPGQHETDKCPSHGAIGGALPTEELWALITCSRHPASIP
jgi:hypothetical protein